MMDRKSYVRFHLAPLSCLSESNYIFRPVRRHRLSGARERFFPWGGGHIVHMPIVITKI